jgi:hypothetical protein
MDAPAERTPNRLLWPNLLLVATVLLHDLDHDALSWVAAIVPIFVAGWLGLAGLRARRVPTPAHSG